MRTTRPARIEPNQTEQPSARMKPAPIQVCIGLIGQALQTSRLSLAHASEGRALGLDLHVDSIDPMEMKRARPGLREMLDTIELAGFAGALVSAPYNREAVGEVDDLSETARSIGAVTTIAFRNGVRLGHNSISWALAETLRRGLALNRLNRVLIVGAGATGAAVAHALGQLDVGEIMIHDADPIQAELLASRCNGVVAFDIASALAQCDGVVNATQIGRADLTGLSLPVDLLHDGHWVADLIDNPFDTPLVRAARELGCTVIDGVSTATYKTIHDFHLLTGRAPNVSRMRTAVATLGGRYRPRMVMS